MTVEEAKTNARTAWVYGFRRRNRWFYVGSTLNPHHREQQLRSRKGGLIGTKFVIIRAADIDQVGRIEKQVIASLKKRGQAVLNKLVSGSRGKSDPIGEGDILWVETGIRFPWVQTASRAFGVPTWVIRDQIKAAQGKPFQVCKLFTFPERQPDGSWSETRPLEGVTLKQISS